ncbi:ATP-grasp domain-containing protein [Georgenia sp. SUBG003]|uniref:ATP-grasp domain-containing protein n=1 Tax=Georgenia sp. SUBG003 TaxID=1497974 RepID=UPI0006937D02
MAASSGTAVRPVILGGDIGAYATARTFHETYGVRSVVLAGVETWAVTGSVAVDHRVVTGLSDPDLLVAAIRDVAAEAPGRTHIVLGSADWLVDALVTHREQLGDVVVPYAGPGAMAQVTDKGTFTALCRELGIPVPETVVLRAGDGPGAAAGLTFPVVVKAASTTAYHAVSFAGKKKVDRADDVSELGEVLSRIAAAGFGGDLLVQELVPGGDAEMAAVNLFFDATGCGGSRSSGGCCWRSTRPGRSGTPSPRSPASTPRPSTTPAGCWSTWDGAGSPTWTSSGTPATASTASSRSTPASAAAGTQ